MDQQVTLSSPPLSPGAHNLRIELDKADPLQIDNVRYTTINVADQQPALIVADDADAARVLRLALSPGSSESATSLQRLTRRIAERGRLPPVTYVPAK